MNQVFAFGLVMLGGPTPALAAASPSARPTVVSGRQLADGTIRHESHPHAWRANARPGHERAWAALASAMGSTWATWSARHPRQIIGEGIAAPGVTASAAEAERVATELLAQHLELLAPGTDPRDFVPVANVESQGRRSVGFAQYSDGLAIVGAQIGFTFSHDRLVLITSMAQPPGPAITEPASVLHPQATARALDWIDRDFAPATRRAASAVKGPMLLPVGDPAAPRLRSVVQVEVESEAPLGRWSVYLDAHTGEPVARESTMHHASGSLRYNVPERSPIFGRSNRITPFTEHLVDGVPQLSDASGAVSFSGSTASIQPGLRGSFIEVIDETSPPQLSLLSLDDGDTVVWSVADDERVDAQLSAYAHTSFVKEYVRTLDPTLAWLDNPIRVFVNIDDECNAMSDGDSIYFLRAGDNCENTARMSDVIYHEFGHSVHNQALIPGVGSFDGALSEGISDYLAATLVNDSGMGRGFFYNDQPLRELDPEGYEWTWPDDNGESHAAGRIIGGTLWDLRTRLIEKYGAEEGIRRTDALWYHSIRIAVDMPSMYGAALIVDDDDGDLSNGTPNGCEINEAFGRHGLFSAAHGDAERVRSEVVPEGLRVQIDVSIPSFDACPIEASAQLEYRARDSDDEITTVPMQSAAGGYAAIIPALPDGQVMNYRVAVLYSVGTTRIVPPNLALPWFEHWFGPTEPIYCTSFDGHDPDQWVLSGSWELDRPGGQGGDPSGTEGSDPFVLGTDLSGDGFYDPLTTQVARGPSITIPPHRYSSVRLHYRRWLTVEDGFYDQAVIYADDQPAWSNFASDDDFGANVHHRDTQWMFHDVDLTPWASDGEISLAFELVSDGGLQMGGWTIDELCIVGYRGLAATECGDGVRAGAEECDDNNVFDGDGCSASCRLEPNNGSDEDGPDSNNDDSLGTDPGLDEDYGLIDRGCGCRAPAPSRHAPPAVLGLLMLLSLRRRRSIR